VWSTFILALGLFVISARRMTGEAHAAQVGNNDGVGLGESGGEGRPHVSRLAIPMEKDHRWPMPADAGVDDRAVDRDLPDFEIRRERLNLGGGWRPHQQSNEQHPTKSHHV
jgi:hypothetical protein